VARGVLKFIWNVMSAPLTAVHGSATQPTTDNEMGVGAFGSPTPDPVEYFFVKMYFIIIVMALTLSWGEICKSTRQLGTENEQGDKFIHFSGENCLEFCKNSN
jgi:hypothetical protein